MILRINNLNYHRVYWKEFAWCGWFFSTILFCKVLRHDTHLTNYFKMLVKKYADLVKTSVIVVRFQKEL